MPDIETAFELERATTSYGTVPAIENLSLRVPVHGTVGLVGVNGAGKSTTLRLIAGLMPLHTGKARFFGRPCPTKAGRVIRPGVALVPEGRRLFPEMTVEENLIIGAFRIPSGEMRSELEKVYQTFPRLHERRGQKAGTLSGGEQQMAAIGRALMSRPTLLLLDEPTLGLSPKIVETVITLINDIAHSKMSIVLVEQNASAALRLTEYTYILDAGKVAYEGATAEIKDSGLVEATFLAKESAAHNHEQESATRASQRGRQTGETRRETRQLDEGSS